jgi:FMN-dependent NADH-azoreductase
VPWLRCLKSSVRSSRRSVRLNYPDYAIDVSSEPRMSHPKPEPPLPALRADVRGKRRVDYRAVVSLVLPLFLNTRCASSAQPRLTYPWFIGWLSTDAKAMTHILHVDSSPRGERSISRTLTKEFITAWKQIHTNDTATYRDLGHHLVPPVDESWIAAAFSPPEQVTPELAAALDISNELIDEFLAADRYVFGIPMYNFSVPSNFKAYIDQIVRVGRTFIVGQNGEEGLVKDKKMLVITARGGSYPAGRPMGQLDFQEPYLRAIFGFIGITDITFIHAENLTMGNEARQQSLAEASAAIQKAVATW